MSQLSHDNKRSIRQIPYLYSVDSAKLFYYHIGAWAVSPAANALQDAWLALVLLEMDLVPHLQTCGGSRVCCE